MTTPQNEPSDPDTEDAADAALRLFTIQCRHCHGSTEVLVEAQTEGSTVSLRL